MDYVVFNRNRLTPQGTAGVCASYSSINRALKRWEDEEGYEFPDSVALARLQDGVGYSVGRRGYVLCRDDVFAECEAEAIEDWQNPDKKKLADAAGIARGWQESPSNT